MGTSAAEAQFWSSTSNTNFNNSANWSNGTIPNSGSAIASFTNATAGIAQTIDLQSSVTLNQLNFSTTNYTFTNSTANSAGITLANLTFTGITANLTQDLSAVGLTFNSATSTLALVGSNANFAATLNLGAVTVANGASLVITRSLIGNQNQNRVITLNQVGTFSAGGDVAIQQLFGGASSTNAQLRATFGTFAGVGNLTITGGGSATSVTIGSFAGSGNLNVYNASTAVTLSDFSGSGNLNVFDGTVTVTGSGFTGNGNLNITSGTVLINGTLAGSGGVSFTGGSLRFTPTAATTISKNIAILSPGGSGIEIRNSSATASNTLTITGNISNGGVGMGLRTLTLAGQNTGNNLLNSTLTDGASGNILGLVVNNGVWFLGGANSFSGGVTISGGVLGFSALNNLGHAANLVTLTLGSAASNSASGLTYSSASGSVSLTSAFRLTGTDTGGAIFRNNSAATSNTLLIGSAASLVIDSTNARLVSFGGTNTGLNEVATVLANDVSGTTLGVAKIESGTWVLSGNNSFSGQSTLAAGTLIVAHANALGAATWNVTGGTLQSDATPRTVNNPLALLGTLTLSGETSLTLGGNVTVSAAARTIDNQNVTTTNYLSGGSIFLGESGAIRDVTIRGAATSTLQINSTITSGLGGTGGSVLYATGNFIINGANSYGGTTTVNAGTITLGNNLAFGSSAVNFTGGTLQTHGSAITLTNAVNLLGITKNLVLAGDAVLTLSNTITTSTSAQITFNNTAGVTLNNVVLNASTVAATTLTIAGNGPGVILGLITEGGTTTANLNITNTSADGVTLKNLPLYRGTTNVSAGSRLNLDLSSDGTFTNVITGAGGVALSGAGITTTFSGVNLYTGITSILSGTLSLSGGNDRLAAVSALAVANAATLNLNGVNQTVGGLSGTGTVLNGAAATTSVFTVSGGGTYGGNLTDGAGVLALQKNGVATLTLNGTNTFSGGTTILNGTLVAGTALPGTGNVTLNGGVLGLHGNLTLSVGVGNSELRWTGTGGIAAVGGDLTVRFETNGNLSNTDALLWGTTVQTGTFLINTQALVLGSTVADGRLTIVNPFNLSNNAGQVREFQVLDNPNSPNDYAVISGIISNNTQFKKSGAGLLILTGGNTFSNTSQITGGTLQIGEGGTTGNFVATTVTNNAVLLFNRSDNIGYGAGIISGTGAVGQIGTGKLTLTSDNTYTGITTIGPGSTLQLGNAGAAGSIADASNVADAGTLIFNRNNAYAYNGSISGVGGVVQAGTGTTTLGGNNSYSGVTSVAAGTLVITGTLGNTAVTVASAATLVGSGVQLGGSVDVLAGGSLALSGTVTGGLSSAGVTEVAGAGSTGSLTVASLILGGGSLNFDLASLVGSDQILIAGGTAPLVNADTTLNFNNLGITQGTYHLIAGFGSNTLAALDFSRLILGQSTLGGFNLSLTNHAGSLDLIVSSALPNLVWSGAASNAWNTTDANFTGDATVYSDGVNVLFNNSTSSYNVVIDAAGVQPASLVVDNDGSHTYTFSGGAIGGVAGLAKQGVGTLVLANDNTFTGDVNVSGGGTLQLGNGAATGSLTPTLNIVFGGNSSLIVDRAGSISLSGNLSGSGNLIKRGSGTLSLFGTSTYSGDTTVSGGTLRVGGNGVLANTVDALYNVVGGTLSIDGAVAQSLPNVSLSGGGTLNVDTASLTTVTLNVNGGTVNVNNGLTVGDWNLLNGTVNVNVNSTLSTLTTFGGGGSGSQTIVNIAGGTTLTIAAGLTFDATGNPNGAIIAGPGQLTLSSTTNRTITVNDSSAADNDLTISAVLSSSSSFTKSGPGTLYLTGVNALVNTNTLNGGTLKVSNSGALGSGQLNIAAASSVLSADGAAQTITNNIGLLSAVAFSGTQNLNLTGTITVSAAGRTINFNNTGGSVISINNIALSETATVGRNLTLGGTGTGAIAQITDTVGSSAPGNVIVNGAGLTLTLANTNGYGGATSIVNGNVYVGNIGSLGTTNVAATVGQQGTGQVNPSLFTSGAVSITRNFNVLSNTNAASSVTFGGATADASSFSGNITFSSSLRLSSVTGGTVTFSGLTAVGSTAGITKGGNGTVVLSGNNAYAGASSVAAGTLQVTGTLGNTAVSIASGATLLGSGTLGGTVSNSGTLSGGLTIGSTVTNDVGGAITPGSLGTVGTLTIGGLILNGGSLNFDLGATGAGNSDFLSILGGSLNVSGTTTFNFNAIGGFGLGTYNLISGYTGAISGFNLLSAPSLFSNYSLTLADNAGVLQLLVTASSGSSGPQNLAWAGGSGTWGSSNYQGSATYTNGDAVTFNDSAGTSTVAIVGSVTPGAVTVNNLLGNTYVFSGGPITGTATLNKLGAGTLVLADDNTFTGPTTVAAGSLELRGAFASSNVTVSGGLIFNPSSGNQTINTVIAGNGTLQKLGSGTTTLLGNNTFNGPTAVDAGSLIVGNAATLSGTVAVNNATFVANGDVRGHVVVNSGGVLHGNGSVGAVVLQNGGTLSVGNSVGSLTIDGDNAGGPALTLNAGSVIEFEFNDVDAGPGIGWDYVELGAGMLTINATNFSLTDRVEVHINSLTLANAHGANDFNAAAATPSTVQEYYWKFIGLNDLSQISMTGPSSLSGRFHVVDDLVGAGVFDLADGNPYDRPINHLGQGTFKVLAGNFGQGNGLYIYYSAVPEPGSMLLAGLGSIAAGWYGRRKLRRKQNDETVAILPDENLAAGEPNRL